VCVTGTPRNFVTGTPHRNSRNSGDAASRPDGPAVWDAAFIERLEGLVGRRLRKGKPGPKPKRTR